MVAPPQTEHFMTGVRRSGEIERFACSSISAGTTVSGLGCSFRFISVQAISTMAELTPGNNPARSTGVLSSFRYLYDCGHIQRRTAARALLAGCHARVLSPQVDFRGHGMGTDRAMGQTLCVILNEWFHLSCLTPSDAGSGAMVVSRIVKNLKFLWRGATLKGI